jgi:penicillin amidase
LNLVYADTAGNIGWAPAARVPVRPNWDGLLPVPGDGRYEWHGFLKGGQLPWRYNPEEGWFATANEMNLPQGYPDRPPISFEWANRSRIDRISEVLSARPKMDVNDSMALQNDNRDLLAGQLISLLAPLAATDPRVSRGLELLRHWDLDEAASSTAATVYQVWVNHLVPMTVERVAPGPVQDLIAGGSLAAIVGYLQHPDARLGPDPSAARNELLIASLGAAVEELNQRLGQDMSAWRWGRVHRMTFMPAIAAVADAQTKARLALPAVELGGSGNSPHAAAFDPPQFDVVAGASVRMVLDVGNWDGSVMINAPGQSADPSSPHYADLLRLWGSGQYVPLLFTRAAIDQAAEAVMTLEPETVHQRRR